MKNKRKDVVHLERCNAWKECPQTNACPFYGEHEHNSIDHSIVVCRYVHSRVRCVRLADLEAE